MKYLCRTRDRTRRRGGAGGGWAGYNELQSERVRGMQTRGKGYVGRAGGVNGTVGMEARKQTKGCRAGGERDDELVKVRRAGRGGEAGMEADKG